MVIEQLVCSTQKRLEAVPAVGFLGSRLYRERQQQGPSGRQPTVSPRGDPSATCRVVAAEGMLCVFAMTCEYQAPCTSQRCSSWASHSRAWLEAPEDQFTQAPECFPTNSCTTCLIPTSYRAQKLDLKGKCQLCPSPRIRCLLRSHTFWVPGLQRAR